MRANIVRWLYRREEVECECGFERIGLAFGFVLYVVFVRGLDLHLPSGILRGLL